MILKLYDFKKRNWIYIDNISKLDVSLIEQYCLKKFNKNDKIIKSIESGEIENMYYRCIDEDNCYMLFNYLDNCNVYGWGVFLFDIKDIALKHLDLDRLHIKMIRVIRNNEEETYIVSYFALEIAKEENISVNSIGYILNDDGKTIEKL